MPEAAKQFHTRANDSRQTTTQRGYGSDWQRISKLKRQQTPVCEVCRVALAEDVDHIIPFSGIHDPLRTAWDNLQSICRTCHRAKDGGVR